MEMKLFSIISILVLGTPVVMGFPGVIRVAPANKTMFNSSTSIPPQVTAPVNITLATSSIGCAPQVTASPDQASINAGEFVFTIVNSHTAPVVTMHGHGAGGPPALGKDNEPHTMSQGQTDTFAVPTGVGRIQAYTIPYSSRASFASIRYLLTLGTQWSGRVAMFEDGYQKVLDRATLLEGSFMINQDRALIASKYRDAFTVPMVCECNGVVALGCNLNLNDICPVCHHRYI